MYKRQAIIEGLSTVAQKIPVILPLHPRTKAVLERSGLLSLASEFMTLVEPLGYLDMVQLEKYAALIATDSGGVQKEAFFHHVPCVTLRDETEWTELLHSGWNCLAPPLSSAVVRDTVHAMLGVHGEDIQPYGDGSAAQHVVNRLVKDLCV